MHVGKVLSNNFPDGMAGGHKSLGGGQIPLEVIIPRDEDSEENYQHKVMEHTMTILQDIFSE